MTAGQQSRDSRKPVVHVCVTLVIVGIGEVPALPGVVAQGGIVHLAVNACRNIPGIVLAIDKNIGSCCKVVVVIQGLCTVGRQPKAPVSALSWSGDK